MNAKHTTPQPATPKYRTNMTAALIRHTGTDSDILHVAKVSTLGEQTLNTDTSDPTRLIQFLMNNRHGTPFEHNSFTYYVNAPIFVFREFMRHRVGFSYNEESGRYRQLKPVFYLPGLKRNLTQVGRPGEYTFTPGTNEQWELTTTTIRQASAAAYAAYETMLNAGIAKEVARMVLPVNTYSSMYVTVNARSLMSFLSLRTTRAGSTFPSYPQREIEMVAEQMEAEWAEVMPVTYRAFCDNGRVAP